MKGSLSTMEAETTTAREILEFSRWGIPVGWIEFELAGGRVSNVKVDAMDAHVKRWLRDAMRNAFRYFMSSIDSEAGMESIEGLELCASYMEDRHKGFRARCAVLDVT